MWWLTPLKINKGSMYGSISASSKFFGPKCITSGVSDGKSE